MKKSDTPKCMTPECPRRRQVRGLCKPCYNAANHLVGTNQGTWDEFVRLGLCEAPCVRGAKAKSEFANNFKAITANKEARP